MCSNQSMPMRCVLSMSLCSLKRECGVPLVFWRHWPIKASRELRSRLCNTRVDDDDNNASEHDSSEVEWLR